jgi:hypothetical protein
MLPVKNKGVPKYHIFKFIRKGLLYKNKRVVDLMEWAIIIGHSSLFLPPPPPPPTQCTAAISLELGELTGVAC